MLADHSGHLVIGVFSKPRFRFLRIPLARLRTRSKIINMFSGAIWPFGIHMPATAVQEAFRFERGSGILFGHASGRPPVIRRLLIIQVPDTSDKRGMPLMSRPIDCFSLRFEGHKCVVRMVFHDIFVDMSPLGAALGVCFNVNVGHDLLSFLVLSTKRKFSRSDQSPEVIDDVFVGLGAEAAEGLSWPTIRADAGLAD